VVTTLPFPPVEQLPPKFINLQPQPVGAKVELVRRIYLAIAYSFFFLMLIIPTTFQIERGIVLALLVTGGTLFYVLGKRFLLHFMVATWGFITVLTSLFHAFNGVVLSAPGAISVMTVFVVWPILFIFFIGMIGRFSVYLKLMKIIIFGAIISSLMGLLMIADALLGLGLGLVTFFRSQGAIIGLYDGEIEYQLWNITTIVYTFPFLVATLLLPDQASAFPRSWRVLILIALGLCFCSLLIAGRRAFWIVALISPLVAFALARMSGIQTRMVSFSIKALVIVILLLMTTLPFLELDFTVMVNTFLTGFDPTGQSESSYLRIQQFFRLMRGWAEHPLIGSGLGATLNDFKRSDTQPWSYELTYVALLFQTGLVGVLIYGSAIFWIFHKGIYLMRTVPGAAAYLLPTLSALFCFLLANGTNPYIFQFDYLWAIFLPVGIINLLMIRNPR